MSFLHHVAADSMLFLLHLHFINTESWYILCKGNMMNISVNRVHLIISAHLTIQVDFHSNTSLNKQASKKKLHCAYIEVKNCILNSGVISNLYQGSVD